MITYGEGTDPSNPIDCYEGVELTIGKYCSIGSGLKILSGKHPCIKYPNVVSQYPFHEMWGVNYPPSEFNGKVTIGSDVWISTDVSILEGVTVGDGAILGAKAVVTKDVPPYAFVAGNPAKVKYTRFIRKHVSTLLKIKWWNWPEDKIRHAMPWLDDIEDFVKIYA